MNAVVVILDRPEFEHRLAAFYGAQPSAQLVQFIRANGAQVPEGERLADLRAAVCNVVESLPDPVLAAMAQQVLLGGGD